MKKRDSSLAVRQAALCRLVMLSHSETEGRRALEQIVDNEILAKLSRPWLQGWASCDWDSNHEHTMRGAALDRLTDQHLLSSIIWTDPDPNIRVAAVHNLRDDALLAEIATRHEDHFMRVRAVERLSSQQVLAECALNDRSLTVRELAVSRISDQDLLAHIAVQGKVYWYYRWEVSDEGTWKEEAAPGADGRDEDAAILALRKISDRRLLANVAASALSDEVRQLAREILDVKT